MLRLHILPTFEKVALKSVTTKLVREWYKGLAGDFPNARAQTYSLLRVILNTAVDDGILSINPCRVRKGGKTKRARTIKVLNRDEVERPGGSHARSLPGAGDHRRLHLHQIWRADRTPAQRPGGRSASHPAWSDVGDEQQERTNRTSDRQTENGRVGIPGHPVAGVPPSDPR